MDTIAYQPVFRPALPLVYGPLEFRQERELFERLDQIIDQGDFEQRFTALALLQAPEGWAKASGAARERFARYSALALRSNIARKITGLSFREFSIRAADSALLQWFLRTGEVDRIKSPSKSSLERFSKWVDIKGVEELSGRLLSLCGQSASEGPPQPLSLVEPLSCTEAFLDATCLKLNIHFPIDWVLLRDAARTLMKATTVIRHAGLKVRMPQEPLVFLTQMNKLCIVMSAQRRRPDSKKARKKVLRQMKALEKKIAGHARAHRDVLEQNYGQSNLSQAQARAVMKRIDGVLEKLPEAIWQVQERMIGERVVPNDKKILSLYEPEVCVLVRGKAGAEVEFGNKLWLAESRCGFIIDWQLLKDAPSDAALLKPGVERLKQKAPLPIKQVWGDRGLFSKANVKYLQDNGMQSGLCPRDPRELKRKLDQEEGFGEGLRRRGGVEGRIAIFKNVFIGSPIQAKGFANQEMEVGWAALTHNLWVVARQPKQTPKPQKEPTPPLDEMLERLRSLQAARPRQRQAA